MGRSGEERVDEKWGGRGTGDQLKTRARESHGYDGPRAQTMTQV